MCAVRVCLVCPSLKAGGMERVMSDFANYLSQDSMCDVHLILFSDADRFFQVSREVSTHILDSRGTSQALNFVKRYRDLRSTLRRLQPKAVLSFGSVYNSFVLLAALGLKLRVYVSDRSNPYRNTEFSFRRDPIKRHDGPVQFILRKWLYRKAAGILVQTEAARAIERSFSNHPNILLFPNPVRPITHREELRRQKIVLNVGRFIDTKNQFELIEIFAKVRFGDWQLVFLGDGPNATIAQQKAKDLGMEGSVAFPGNVVDVERYISSSEIFAFTSLSEGFPNALLEAMSGGLACVSYDCVAGPNELIDDGKNGYLIPLGRRDIFSERLLRLMEDPHFRRSMQAKAQSSVKNRQASRVYSEVKRELLRA